MQQWITYALCWFIKHIIIHNSFIQHVLSFKHRIGKSPFLWYTIITQIWDGPLSIAMLVYRRGTPLFDIFPCLWWRRWHLAPSPASLVGKKASQLFKGSACPPVCPLFLGFNASKQGPFQKKTKGHLGSRKWMKEWMSSTKGTLI